MDIVINSINKSVQVEVLEGILVVVGSRILQFLKVITQTNLLSLIRVYSHTCLIEAVGALFVVSRTVSTCNAEGKYVIALLKATELYRHLHISAVNQLKLCASEVAVGRINGEVDGTGISFLYLELVTILILRSDDILVLAIIDIARNLAQRGIRNIFIQTHHQHYQVIVGELANTPHRRLIFQSCISTVACGELQTTVADCAVEYNEQVGTDVEGQCELTEHGIVGAVDFDAGDIAFNIVLHLSGKGEDKIIVPIHILS